MIITASYTSLVNTIVISSRHLERKLSWIAVAPLTPKRCGLFRSSRLWAVRPAGTQSSGTCMLRGRRVWTRSTREGEFAVRFI